jgi:hypothetical protein
MDETIQWLRRTLIPDTGVVREAEEHLMELFGSSDHLLILTRIATHERNPICLAALIQIKNAVRHAEFAQDETTAAFFQALAELLDTSPYLALLKSFTRILGMRTIYGGPLPFYLSSICAMLPTSPRAGLILTCSLLRTLADRDADKSFFEEFMEFSASVLPLFQGILALDRDDLSALVMHSLSRMVIRLIPSALCENCELFHLFLEASVRFLEAGGNCFHYALRFWARLICAGFIYISPVMFDLALRSGTARLTRRSVACSFNVLYELLAHGLLIDMFTKSAVEILVQMVIPCFEGPELDGDNSGLLWKDPSLAAKEFAVLLLVQCEAAVPPFLEWIMTGGELHSSLHLLGSVVEKWVKKDPTYLSEFFVWLMETFLDEQELCTKLDILSFFRGCGSTLFPADFALAILGEVRTFSSIYIDTLSTFTYLAERIPDREGQQRVQEAIMEDAADLIGVRMASYISLFDTEVPEIVRSFSRIVGTDPIVPAIEAVFHIFVEAVRAGRDCCTVLCMALESLIIVIMADCTEFLPALFDVFQQTGSPLALRIIADIVYVSPGFADELWQFAPLVFAVDLTGCGQFLLVLAWKGRESFAEHCDEMVDLIFQAMQQADGNISVWSEGLRVLAGIGHIAPAAIAPILEPCLDQIADILLTVDDDSKPFYQFIAFACSAFPEHMAGNELMMAALVNDRTDPDFFPAAVALLPYVDDDLKMAIIDAEGPTLIDELPDVCPWPVCFDAESAIAQFHELRDQLRLEQQGDG